MTVTYVKYNLLKLIYIKNFLRNGIGGIEENHSKMKKKKIRYNKRSKRNCIFSIGGERWRGGWGGGEVTGWVGWGGGVCAGVLRMWQHDTYNRLFFYLFLVFCLLFFEGGGVGGYLWKVEGDNIVIILSIIYQRSCLFPSHYRYWMTVNYNLLVFHPIKLWRFDTKARIFFFLFFFYGLWTDSILLLFFFYFLTLTNDFNYVSLFLVLLFIT